MKQFTEEKPQLDGKDMNNDDMKIVKVKVSHDLIIELLPFG